MTRRLVVIGAGPVGLAAALGGVHRGFDVTVLERDRVGSSLLRWGTARFFSPLAMNVTPEMVEGRSDGSELLTGAQFVDRVLQPAAGALGDRLRCGARVVAVGRAGMRRGDYAGHPVRDDRPFRLLVESGGAESWLEADAVLDATGVYGQPVPLGVGGLPAIGERATDGILRDLGALHDALPTLRERRVLLIGHGHSAAHALAWLGGLADSGTRVVWATRSGNTRPFVDVAGDPLPERARVVGDANRLASAPPPWLRVERRAQVEALRSAEGAVQVQLSGGRTATVDRVVALVGYRPDLSFLSELSLEVSAATEGAGRLSRALASVTDCLSVPAVSPADLASGEPGFHLVGAKSYGRSTTFLLRTGYAQLETVLDGLVRG